MIFKNRGWLAVAVASCALWHLIFEWPILDYPSYAKGPCYSLNHAYYITSHQTLWQATDSFDSGDFGTARLFDRSGKILYGGETYLDGQAGPIWLDESGEDPAHLSEVFYMNGDGPTWIVSLPMSPGRGTPFEDCRHRQVIEN